MWIGVDRRKLVHADDRVGPLNRIVEVLERVARDSAQIHGLEWLSLSRDARELQQVLDQLLHPLGRGVGAFDVVQAALREPLAFGIADALGERADLA